MTQRSIWRRLSDAFILARSQYRELKADLGLMRKYWRGPVVVCFASFIIGAILL